MALLERERIILSALISISESYVPFVLNRIEGKHCGFSSPNKGLRG